jgi:hypothetical protein
MWIGNDGIVVDIDVDISKDTHSPRRRETADLINSKASRFGDSRDNAATLAPDAVGSRLPQ